MTPYPVDFPFAEAQNVVRYFGGTVALEDAVHDAWVCAGYGLSITVGKPVPAAAPGPPVRFLSDSDLHTKMAATVPTSAPPPGAQQTVPPIVWELLREAVRRILDKFGL